MNEQFFSTRPSVALKTRNHTRKSSDLDLLEDLFHFARFHFFGMECVGWNGFYVETVSEVLLSIKSTK